MEVLLAGCTQPLTCWSGDVPLQLRFRKNYSKCVTGIRTATTSGVPQNITLEAKVYHLEVFG